MSGAPRRALVTGGSGALGAAICEQLAQAGHYVYVHAHRNQVAAEQLVQQLRARQLQAEPLVFDVTDAHASRAALEPLLEGGAIQILVNNAGVHHDAVFAGMSAAQWQQVLNVSLQGFFNVTQPLLLPMLRTRWGRILNMASVAAQSGNRGQVNYAAAKGALISATRALALEVASRGVTVNALAPGIIEGGMGAGHFDPSTIARLVPIGRAGAPADVAAAAVFLASDAAAYITGQVLSINGGMY